MLLAVYGTLRPSGDNHYEVRAINGEWRPGTVRGWRYEIGWGPAEGYPGISLDPDGPLVDVDVLDSPELDRHLDRIDRFEGPGYKRVTTTVRLDDGTDIEAWIYEADPEA